MIKSSTPFSECFPRQLTEVTLQPSAFKVESVNSQLDYLTITLLPYTPSESKVQCTVRNRFGYTAYRGIIPLTECLWVIDNVICQDQTIRHKLTITQWETVSYPANWPKPRYHFGQKVKAYTDKGTVIDGVICGVSYNPDHESRYAIAYELDSHNGFIFEGDVLGLVE